ncbi:MAG: sporulation protein YqfD [Clostridia bacterium]|nr:sporulation protein YqfD [Clostridia bacterium]
MIFSEKIEYYVNGNTEYVINLLAKHNIKVSLPQTINDGCKIKVLSKDKKKLEKILKDYGKNFELIKIYDYGINIKKLIKKFFLWLGILASIVTIALYSQTVTGLKISGCNFVDELIIKQAILDEVKLPTYHSQKDFENLKKKIVSIDGISYASVEKVGRTLKVYIVEELSKIDKIDAQNLVSIKAKGSGVITKITVYGGTSLVNIGDRVEVGQDLIAPYLLNIDGEKKSTLALGFVEAKIEKIVQISYSSEKEYYEKFVNDYSTQTEKIKRELSTDDKYLGSHFFVKNVDKSIVCSIYYDIITRIT